MYALVAFNGYAYLGEGCSGFITTAMEFSVTSRIASGLLAVHLIITYLVKGTVLARYIHIKIFPATVNDRSIIGKGHVPVPCAGHRSRT